MSNPLLIWLIVGALLFVAELTTGTLYLLVFGIAAWVAAGAVYFDYSLTVQLISVGIASMVGLAILIPYDIRRRTQVPASSLDQEIGNNVTVKSVSTEGKARVAYRGSTWDAVAESNAMELRVGEIYTIAAVNGNTLVLRMRT